ncbi:MAG TPA: class I SAM-dependent methyltransferase [Ornithinibacter sp.]|nr:class I SAM-dependent methyltransferase [Ornithinibacter sp.]
MDPVDSDGVRAAYDTVAEAYAARLPDTRAEAAADLAMVDAFAAAVAAGDDPRVLDAGCGTGRMSAYLAARGCLVEGVDLSPGMVAMARRANPELRFEVGSLSELPCADAEFAGVLLWYSVIHTPPSGLARIVAEVARVLRPGGYVLVGMQAGQGTRDVAPSYRKLGLEVVLERHLHTADAVAAHLAAVGLAEVRRLERPAQDGERDDQAVLLARASRGGVGA